MVRGVSPPPAKRRRVPSSKPTALTTTPSTALRPCDPSSLRLISWNVNGIAPFLQKSITSYFQKSDKSSLQGGVPPASLRAFLQRHGWPSLLFLQEVKIASIDIKTQDAVKAAANERTASERSSASNQGPKYDVYFTLPTDRYNARGLGGSGKVYGVASIIRSDVLPKFKFDELRARTVEWDSEGRVNIIEMTSPTLNLALFNIYAVNGTDNLYRNSTTGAIAGTRHDRKLAFHRLLRDECASLERDGWRVVLAGDFNVAPDERDGHPKLRTFPAQHVLNRADFLEKFFGKRREARRDITDLATASEWRGFDIWRETHGDQRGYTYYSRGREWGTSCDRVDYVIAGRSTWEDGRIASCGILESEAERGPSDHCPVWADIKIGMLEKQDNVSTNFENEHSTG
ncbi:Endonuclease/exonuclease/phosphatase [Lophiotrema nucula]|uniref:Endonuclease/exonuclease/phosphatase n=1 Tax=Lophiotrema nucula TaxID=690887 RepID=A0A6A5YVZ1_9PLEO|nr:Endonuclease/exonuclease/phosphatase [Lophiotrema nucula]